MTIVRLNRKKKNGWKPKARLTRMLCMVARGTKRFICCRCHARLVPLTLLASLMRSDLIRKVHGAQRPTNLCYYPGNNRLPAPDHTSGNIFKDKTWTSYDLHSKPKEFSYLFILKSEGHRVYQIAVCLCWTI